MYNVGFGDCFFLRIPTDDGERRMLVDCGYHSHGRGEFDDKSLVAQIKSDLAGETLDVVVATHRHQDHISGYGEAPLWADVAVQEVWLPFTANPKTSNEEPALRAWEGLMHAAHGLFGKRGTLTLAATKALGARNAEERAEIEFMLWNARTNAPGIENLLRGFKRADGRAAKRRFLPERRDEYPTRFTTPVLPGVTVHVLGPPADPASRRNRKVPSSWGFEDAMRTGVGSEADSPFSEEWYVPAKRLPSRRPFHDKTLETIRFFNDDLLYAAKGLEGFLNGESLVFVLEIGGARLLLTGDAEVGAWTTILGSPDALALAAGATFLKIGHHGSHNATPLVFVNEHLAREVPAMISTQQGPGRYRNGIPLDRLLDALKTRSMPFVRSDKPPARANGLFKADAQGRWVDGSIPC